MTDVGDSRLDGPRATPNALAGGRKARRGSVLDRSRDDFEHSEILPDHGGRGSFSRQQENDCGGGVRDHVKRGGRQGRVRQHLVDDALVGRREIDGASGDRHTRLDHAPLATPEELCSFDQVRRLGVGRVAHRQSSSRCSGGASRPCAPSGVRRGRGIHTSSRLTTNRFLRVGSAITGAFLFVVVENNRLVGPAPC